MDFRETQRIDVIWLRWLLAFSGVAIFTVFTYLILTMPDDADRMGMVAGMLISILTLGIAYAMLFFTELQTAINATGWEFKYAPFIYSPKTLQWNDITSWRMVNITDNVSYIGYGLGYKKQSIKKITSIMMGGREAVEFTLKNGHVYIFNTRRSAEVKSALNKYIATKQTVK